MKTIGEIYDFINPVMTHCGCGRDALEAAKKIQPHIEHLHEVLRQARILLVAHRGDIAYMTEAEVTEGGYDKVHWAVLKLIQDALGEQIPP